MDTKRNRAIVYRLILIAGTFAIPVPFFGASERTAETASGADSFFSLFTQPFPLLLLQILVILIAARLFGKLFARMGQPTVVGEIVAGIALGPSVFGWIMPGFSSFLFPPDSLGYLHILSQTGLILFMFIVGMELDWKILQTKARDAAIISQASIIFPFLLGTLLAFYLYKRFPPDLDEFLPFSLFIALSMSVTAFPVLARIAQERGISRTRTGVLAITSAALNDVTAWSVLAIVVAIVKAGSLVSALNTIGLAVTYVLVMLLVVRPFLASLGEAHSGKETLNKGVVGLYLILLILSSLLTEIIGIHALFGAFIAGLVMPENIKFREILTGKIEDIAIVLFLPIFFVSTGLRTEIGLLNEGSLWVIAALVIVLAVAGKVFGSAIPARLVGQSWRDSLIIGTLMNTRGLMELVVLNIGFDLGLLTPELFVIMVLMAVTTTLITGPGLRIIDKLLPVNETGKSNIIHSGQRFNILLSFGNPESGKAMLRVANSLVRNEGDLSSITALHFTPLREMKLYNEESIEDESFKAIREEAAKLGVEMKTTFKGSRDLTRGILETANSGQYDFLMIGMGPVPLKGTMLGQLLNIMSKIFNPSRLAGVVDGREVLFNEAVFSERVRRVLSGCRIAVGVFINKDLAGVEEIVVPYYSEDDRNMVFLAGRVATANNLQVSVFDVNGMLMEDHESVKNLRSENTDLQITKTFPPTIKGGAKRLTIVSIEHWPQYSSSSKSMAQAEKGGSVLIVKRGNN